MASRTERRQTPSPAYVIGRKSFAAISAVEGLSLTADAKIRLQRTRALSPEERRAETILAFAGAKKRR